MLLKRSRSLHQQVKADTNTFRSIRTLFHHLEFLALNFTLVVPPRSWNVALTGPEKLKLLEKIDIQSLLPNFEASECQAIQHLWKELLSELYYFETSFWTTQILHYRIWTSQKMGWRFHWNLSKVLCWTIHPCIYESCWGIYDNTWFNPPFQLTATWKEWCYNKDFFPIIKSRWHSSPPNYWKTKSYWVSWVCWS